MFITPSFKKSLMVEQFQGNYLNRLSAWGMLLKFWLILASTLLLKKVLVKKKTSVMQQP